MKSLGGLQGQRDVRDGYEVQRAVGIQTSAVLLVLLVFHHSPSPSQQFKRRLLSLNSTAYYGVYHTIGRQQISVELTRALLTNHPLEIIF